MAQLRLEIGLDGDRQVNETLISKKKKIQDFRDAWIQIRNFLIRSMADQFRTEGGRAQKWQELSEQYAARKAAKFPGKTILRRTDRLYDSLTKIGTTEHIFVSKPLEMLFGTGVWYSRIHQLGGGRVPRRRILSLTQDDRAEVRKLAQLHLAGN